MATEPIVPAFRMEQVAPNAQTASLAVVIGSKSRGSNLRAIASACAAGAVSARIGAVVAPIETSPGAVWAQETGLPVRIVGRGENYGGRMLAALGDCDLVCLAGYLWLLPSEVLRAFPGRVLNIHPALLPKFGGKGMYGMHVHEAVLAAGEMESGCTVHGVTEVYDEGPILVQKRCPIYSDDTPERLAARLLELEHEAYPEAIQQVLCQSQATSR